jgi:uncharacterized protein (DUF1697 family)
MPTYAALLRGVSPMNLKMTDLKLSLEAAGFTGVETVRSSGNAVFSAPRAAPVASIERAVEAALQKRLGRTFLTIVRPQETLRGMLAADPFRGFRLAPGSKRIITFLRTRPRTRLDLPIELEGARILRQQDKEVFSAYEPSSGGAQFMVLIEKTFGQAVTTRTWETVDQIANKVATKVATKPASASGDPMASRRKK